MPSEPSFRLLTDSDMADAVRLADGIFRQDGRASMAVSLPKVFSPALRQSIGCFAGDRLVSMAGMVPSVIRIGAARLRVFSYGAVCTHPDFRGLGLARSILQFAKRHARQSGASLLLVSGELPLYTEAGCYRFGLTSRYRLRTSRSVDRTRVQTEVYGVREATETDWFRLHEWAAQREVAFDTSLWDLADMLHAQAVASIRRMRHRTYMAEKNGVPVACCTVAVTQADPADEPKKGLAIEWAGDEDAVDYLLRSIANQLKLSELELTVSWHDPLLAELQQQPDVWEALGESAQPGTMHMVDEELLFQQLSPYWKEVSGTEAADGVPRFNGERAGKGTVTIAQDTTPLLDQDALMFLLFGRGGDPLPLDPSWTERRKPYMPVPFPYTKGLHFV